MNWRVQFWTSHFTYYVCMHVCYLIEGEDENRKQLGHFNELSYIYVERIHGDSWKIHIAWYSKHKQFKHRHEPLDLPQITEFPDQVSSSYHDFWPTHNPCHLYCPLHIWCSALLCFINIITVVYVHFWSNNHVCIACPNELTFLPRFY